MAGFGESDRGRRTTEIQGKHLVLWQLAVAVVVGREREREREREGGTEILQVQYKCAGYEDLRRTRGLPNPLVLIL